MPAKSPSSNSDGHGMAMWERMRERGFTTLRKTHMDHCFR